MSSADGLCVSFIFMHFILAPFAIWGLVVTQRQLNTINEVQKQCAQDTFNYGFNCTLLSGRNIYFDNETFTMSASINASYLFGNTSIWYPQNLTFSTDNFQILDKWVNTTAAEMSCCVDPSKKTYEKCTPCYTSLPDKEWTNIKRLMCIILIVFFAISLLVCCCFCGGMR